MRVARDSEEGAFHERARRRAQRAEKGRPGVLAWFAGLGIHAAVVLLLVM